MKIMYYELIKMLIDYERNKQPEVRVTTNLNVSLSNHYKFSNFPRCGTQARALARLRATR